MAVSCQVVRFQKDATNVDGATQDVNLNFTPKAITVFSEQFSATNTASATAARSTGFSDGTNQACTSTLSTDNNAAGGLGAHWTRNDCVYIELAVAAAGTIEARCSAAFATNKVTLTWTVNSATAAWLVLVAYGGDDITNVKVNAVDVVRTTAGTQNYTGLGFNPTDTDSVVFIAGGQNTSLTAAVTAPSYQSFGCAISTSKRWCTSTESESTSDPTDTWRVFSNTKIFFVTNLGAVFGAADFNGYVTDGFQLNWTTAFLNSARKIAYMVIKGGKWDCGTLTAPASATNDVDTAVSVSGNTIRGLMLAGVDTTTTDSITTITQFSMGATDGTTQAAIGIQDEDAQTTTDTYRINNAANVFRSLTTNGAAAATATFDSFTTNNFRLDWSDVVANALVGWVVIADTASAAAAAVEVSYQSYGNIFQAYDSNKNAIYG